MWNSNVTRKRLLENIALLETINKVPKAPSKRELPFSHDPMRSLSIERERQIVGHLAFLAASTKDNRNVMAVCVEEGGDQQWLTFRIASNTGYPHDVLECFERLSRCLEHAAEKGQFHYSLKVRYRFVALTNTSSRLFYSSRRGRILPSGCADGLSKDPFKTEIAARRV